MRNLICTLQWPVIIKKTDCGLKNRGWDETKKALVEMISAAKEMRESIKIELTV